jgi:cellulose biosynthesis protein BcsQ
MGLVGRVVAVVNQKGGVGKTTVTLGLASAAAIAGHRVLVVDLDPQASSTWVLGVDPAHVTTSGADVLTCTPAATAIVSSTWGDRVDVLPASIRLQDLASPPADRLRTALASLADRYDVVLIDLPPSLGDLTLNGLTAADLALIVVEPSALSIRGIAALADVVDEVWARHNPDLELAGVVVNKVPALSLESDRRLEELDRVVGHRAVWHPMVPQRVIVNQAIGERRPIHAYGARSIDVSAVFDALWTTLRGC